MRKFYIVLGLLVLLVPKVEAQSVPYTKNSAEWYPFVEALNRGDKQVLNFGCGSLVEVMNKNFSEMHMNDCRDVGNHASILKQINCPAELQYVARIVDNKVTNSVDTVSLLNQKCRLDSAYNRVEFAESGALILGAAEAPVLPTSRKAAPTKAVVVGGKPSLATPPPRVNTVHDTLPPRVIHDTLPPKVVHDTLHVSQEEPRCWRWGVTKCTVLTTLGTVVAGVVTYIGVCHNPPNKIYTACGGEPDTTRIHNKNTHVVIVSLKTGAGRRGIELGASLPTSVVFGLLRRR